MADMHILAGSDSGQVRVVMHFDVPVGNNAVEVSWADALANSDLGGTTQMNEGTAVWEITTEEKTAVEAGTIRELLVSFDVEKSGVQPADLRDHLRRQYVRREANEVASLQKRLKYFGHTEARA